MPSFTSLSSSSPEGEYYYSAGGATCLSCLPCCQHHHPLNQASSRSMGPFAESMGLSANMAMWLAVVQLPVTMGLALHYPTVRIDVFSTTVRTVTDLSNNNQTLTVVVASPDGSAVEVSCANVSVNLHTHMQASSHCFPFTGLRVRARCGYIGTVRHQRRLCHLLCSDVHEPH